MELKQFQRLVLADLRRYLTLIRLEGDYQRAYASFWLERGIQLGKHGMRSYQEDVPCVPHVCFKVPTGGGKTYLAANTLRPLLESLPQPRINAVVWLVPSDSILRQTLLALKNPNHPYRQRLNADFGGRVTVYSKEEAMMGQNFSPVTVSEQLSILVLSYDSFRTSNAEGRRAYRENSAMLPFREAFRMPDKPIDGADDTALFQIINQFNPIVIVDESHHAQSKLSVDMLQNFNPAFVLELTATPQKRSNIISYVEAAALKAEHMVKLPVIVYNRKERNEVLADAIDLRRQLELIAQDAQTQGSPYIRPIVLFQAQQRGKEDAATFDKLKDKLLKLGIPAEEIAIKTSSINELGDTDLLSPGCPIRYIITVNALKEGWDCPFAYILATLANRTSQVDVEQVLGRVLRQPHAVRHQRPELNLSYVLTSSEDFGRTLDKVVEGLQAAGFGKDDYRQAQPTPPPSWLPPLPDTQEQDDFFDLIPEIISKALEERQQVDATPWKVNSATQTMLTEAVKQAEAYTQALEQQHTDGAVASVPAALKPHISQYPMLAKYREKAQAMALPCFVRVVPEGLFTKGQRTLLNKDHLLEGFTLIGKPYDVDFTTPDNNLYKVDVEDSRIYHTQLIGQEASAFKGIFVSGAPEKQTDRCKRALLRQLAHLDGVSESQLAKYVGQIVHAMNKDQLDSLEKGIQSAALKIEQRIMDLMAEHQEKVFDTWLEQGKIICEGHYQLPPHQSPASAVTSMHKSLYEGEHEMNPLERSLASALGSLPNILWWHRNPSKIGFRINGFINHYPDIIALTSQGRVLVIETKADYNRNADDARKKLDQGRRWQEKAGEGYQFYIVVESKSMAGTGAYPLNEFITLAQGL